VSEGFTWLCVRPCEVRQVNGSRFVVRWLDDPERWRDATCVAFTANATLLRLRAAWLLLTHTAPPVAYRDADVAKIMFERVA
jgi:hypothetical protein